MGDVGKLINLNMPYINQITEYCYPEVNFTVEELENDILDINDTEGLYLVKYDQGNISILMAEKKQNKYYCIIECPQGIDINISDKSADLYKINNKLRCKILNAKLINNEIEIYIDKSS